MPPPTQPWPWTSNTNALQRETPSYESAEFQDIDMITGRESTISPAFIEAVSQSMGFSTSDEDYRNSLHSIPKVRCACSTANITLTSN